MTAPTLTQPWTEEEVREALARSIGEGFGGLDNVAVLLRVVVDCDVARTRMPWDRDFHPDDDHPGTLWADLRPDEEEDLDDVVFGVLRQVEEEATAMLLERAVAVVLAFQERHPDVPRGHYPLVPAKEVAP